MATLNNPTTLHGESSSVNYTPKKSSDLNRACEACRSSKVRCLPSPGSSQCQRCAKHGKSCVFAAPAKRRQRKRTDVRVSELEKEIRQMRSLLRQGQVHISEGSEPENVDEGPEEDDEDPPAVSESPQGSHSQSQGPAYLAGPTAGPSTPTSDNTPSLGYALVPSMLDIMERGVISWDLAEDLLQSYKRDKYFPGVVIPPEITAVHLWKKKPALFCAIMAAASRPKGAALSNRLHDEVVLLYARQLFIEGKRSLEYIQALLVTVIYYAPSNSMAQMQSQIYQFGTMAASMALELGLASKPRTHEQLPKRAIRPSQRISSAGELLQNCRLILSLYVMCAGFSMRLRRPNIMQYNSWMEECLTLLSKSPLVEDQKVVALLKLQRIADEANTAFGFDDASTSFTLSELRLKVILKVFDQRMQKWKDSLPKEVIDSFLMIVYHQNMMSMWEFAVDGGRYDAPEFNNRHLTLPALDADCVQPETLLSRSALQINGLVKVIDEAHAIMEIFSQYDTYTLQSAPNVIFVRPIYALVALMKADYAIGTDASGIGEVLDSQSLKIDQYLDTCISMTQKAIGPQECRVPQHWLFILSKLKEWHDEHQIWRRDRKYVPKFQEAVVRDSMPEPTFVATIRSHASAAAVGGDTAQQQLPVPTSTASATTPYVPSTGMNFGVGNAFAPWPASGLATDAESGNEQLLAGNTQELPAANQAAFAPSMGDLEMDLQNGPLYLWNPMLDNFTGWMPQDEAMYDAQYGGLGGAGL